MAELNVNQTTNNPGANTRPPTVPHWDVFKWHNDHAARIVRQPSLGKISAAVGGIQALCAILYQREADTNCEGENLMVLPPAVAEGVVQAIACCAALVEEAMTDQAFTTGIEAGSKQEKKLWEIEREAQKIRADAQAAAWGAAPVRNN